MKNLGAKTIPDQAPDDGDKMYRARVALKEIFGEGVGVIWGTHFTEDIRQYLVADRLVYLFDNTFTLEEPMGTHGKEKA